MRLIMRNIAGQVPGVTSQAPAHFLEMIGKALPHPGTNGFSPAMAYGQVMVAINPIRAEIIARDMPDLADVQEAIRHHASLPADLLQSLHSERLEAQGRARTDGRVYLRPNPST